MASVAGGEDHALKGPEFVVKGATDFDQRWIDETTEAGIAALGWKRPEPRPPEWDKPLAKTAAVSQPVKKKRGWNLFHTRKPAASG